ncbi:hypothetical protein IU500_22300 [Nocardia terpenica]|uniref:hypothetical protein n=1 Tax=Nocardia terpenica TaxID=455432 RepID=UPI001894E27D|nr:hypothetical protein [Nocardia terpenica]MBF6064604.1 hypothetical protein [Nocardia terpenica]MBF6106772.1 hypothetical protein [Nocardia terpenica]MBF6114572.1 hypothetical protein [Nocardia terpenica]MBF6121342.1 hypothetical protein [Nocardia terpenica]MBF6153757.1 hypothetical protein [Nocardia terpenica]
MDTELTFLGKGGSKVNDCPTLYTTDYGTYVIIGWKTDAPDTIEIPHLLLGFTEKETFIGATMTDTGRGTFTLSGNPVTESRLLAQLKIEAYEAAVEVSKIRREYYGGIEAA